MNALGAGDVVFLCGAGISLPQLPSFEKLVDQVAVELGVQLSSSENTAYKAGRFEEVLGSLSRRLADSSAVRRTVADS